VSGKIKKLASQTAYYGLSSILGRMLNYALVPLHTRVLLHQQDYGVIGELYAYVSFLNIIFLCGMETTYFRFTSKDHTHAPTVYSTAFSWVLLTSTFLCSLLIILSNPITQWLTPNHGATSSLYQQSYIVYFALILGLDAIAAIPFAKLRYENRPRKFAFIKIINICVNVGLNLYWLWLCPYLYTHHPQSPLLLFYRPNTFITYVFIANLIASVVTLLMLYKELIAVKISIALATLKPMLKYAIPLLIAGLAGMTNETLDRILLKYYLKGNLNERLTQIGIYNAAYKLSIFMTLAVQAFRMAAEPFFFSLYKQENAQNIYAKVMDYFVLSCIFIFLGVSLHLDLLTYILGEKYRSGQTIRQNTVGNCTYRIGCMRHHRTKSLVDTIIRLHWFCMGYLSSLWLYVNRMLLTRSIFLPHILPMA